MDTTPQSSTPRRHLRSAGKAMGNYENSGTEDLRQASEDKYRAMVEATGTGYLIIDSTGRVLDANEEYVRLSGHRELHQILGRPVTDWTAAHEKEKNARAVEQCAKVGFIRNMVIDYVDAKGRITPVEINATTVGVGDSLRIVSLCRDVTERKQFEDALRESEERWKFALEGAGDGVWDWNIQTGTAVYSRRWKEMLGFAENEIGNAAAEWSSRVHPDDMPDVMAKIQAHIAGETPSAAVEFRMLCKDGSWKWTLGRGMVVSRSSDGQPLRLVGTNTDISERKQAEAALQEQKDFFHLIAETIGDFIAVLDLDGRRIYNSPSYSHFFGAATDLHGTDSFNEVHPDDRERVKQVFRETVKTGKGRQIQYRMQLANGSIREMESMGNLIRDQEGHAKRVVVVSRDITERKQMEDEVRQMAFYDPLTKLPNRRLLGDRLSQCMAANKRSSCYGALMFLDLDNFKPLNDRHGHVVGDSLLVEVARRLMGCVRQMDTVARFGGDEFIVMLRELNTDQDESTSQARAIAEKIRVRLAEAYVLNVTQEGRPDTAVEHRCTVSIGVTLFIDHESNTDDILKWADIAMYEAKAAGRNVICFHDNYGPTHFLASDGDA
jgi:diguanylate cyclase (GGDEF)-like protein/PAS domain S-box-containing protein